MAITIEITALTVAGNQRRSQLLVADQVLREGLQDAIGIKPPHDPPTVGKGRQQDSIPRRTEQQEVRGAR